MQFCPGIAAWPTSGMPPDHPIPNVLVSHLTASPAGLSWPQGTTLYSVRSWTLPALYSGFQHLCFFICAMVKTLAPSQWPV